ncbi:hypothetical protein [Naumannella huperziae]
MTSSEGRRPPFAVIGAIIGLTGGLAFALVNAGAFGEPWAWLIRGVAIALAIVVLVLGRRVPPPMPEPHRHAGPGYLASVLIMVVAIVAGGQWLGAQGRTDIQPAWVALVVGAHFLPFAWLFRLGFFLPLAVGMIIIAAVGMITGAGAAAAALVGVWMLGWQAGHLAYRLRTAAAR